MSKEPSGVINGVSVNGLDRIVARLGGSTGVTVAGLCALVLFFYSRLWLPDLVLIKRDAYRFFLPLKQYMVERLAAGELPQWFPYEALGRPFIGVPVTGVFHPFTALYFVLPIHDAYRVSVLLSCLLAVVGAFTLGRALGFSRAGALLAGVAFALSGYVVSLTENIVYLYSVCALPLFCAALEKALAGRRVWVVAPAVIWASVFLNGDVQTGYYYGFIALGWAVARAPGAYRAAGLRVALVAGLAALLAGIQLGPAAVVYAGSQRTQPALFLEQALYWSTHPLRLLTLVVSPIGGDADPVAVSHLFFGSRPRGQSPLGLWAESVYLGVPVVGLASLGVWARRDLRVLVLLGVLALLLAMGRYGGLYEVLYHVVPFWSAFRYPERFMGFVAFAAAMLAGAGLDGLRSGRGKAELWVVAAALGGALGLGLGTEGASGWAASTFEAPAMLAREVMDSAAEAFLFSAGATLAVGAVVVGAQRGWLRRELVAVCIVGIVLVDLWRPNWGAYHTGPVEAATFTPGLVQAVRTHARTRGPGQFRLNSFVETEFVSREPIREWLSTAGITSVMMRQALDLEHNAQFHIESGKAYLPGRSARFMSIAAKTFGVEATARYAEATARYNVAYFIGRSVHFEGSRFAPALVASVPDYDLALVRNPAPVKPRAYLSRRPEHVVAPVETDALIARPDFLSGEVDVIEAPATPLPGPAEGGQATIERYAPEEVRVRVETSQPAVLILLDTFEAGWRATLEDGDEIPIMRANALVRAVVVPGGRHLVTFTYETPLLKAGAAASLAGSVLCLGLITCPRERARRGGSMG